MKLSELMNVPYDIEISRVTCDSREVENGTLFICVRGEESDGHDFVSQALEKGAVAFVCEKDIDAQIKIIVPDARRAASEIFSVFFKRPEERLKITGVTGTNGKTSTAYILRDIYLRAGREPAIFGTFGAEYKDMKVETGNTTPLPQVFYPLLRDVVEMGAQTLVMEVSSHALSLGRVSTVFFENAIYTNLSPEHLDFHKNMEEYSLAKESLFERCRRGYFNIDDVYVQNAYKKGLCEGYSFGLSDKAEFRANDVYIGKRKVEYKLSYGDRTLNIKTRLSGMFGLYNSLAAAACAIGDGISSDAIEEAIRDFSGVKGRFEKIYDGAFTVIIDYAHTPDAIEKLLREARRIYSSASRITLLFGCGGNRDRGKRSLMAKASLLADRVIVTSDNCRYEKNEDIIGEIIEGNTSALVIADRTLALEYVIDSAVIGEIILLAGKGHEEYEIKNGEKLEFSERAVVLKRIKTRIKYM